MPNNYTIDSVLVCDDVRLEASGKQILIGVYADVLVFDQLPIQLIRLTFRIQINAHGAKLSKMFFNLRKPSGDSVAKVEGDLPKYDLEEPVVLNIAVAGVIFEAGTYTVELGLDGAPEKIYSFLVRIPKNDEEKQRLTLT